MDTVTLPAHVQSVVDSANDLMRKGAEIHFKFTCGQCGARQTFDEPNTLFTEGTCEECGATTDLKSPGAGVGFMVMMTITPKKES